MQHELNGMQHSLTDDPYYRSSPLRTDDPYYRSSSPLRTDGRSYPGCESFHSLPEEYVRPWRSSPPLPYPRFSQSTPSLARGCSLSPVQCYRGKPIMHTPQRASSPGGDGSLRATSSGDFRGIPTAAPEPAVALLVGQRRPPSPRKPKAWVKTDQWRAEQPQHPRGWRAYKGDEWAFTKPPPPHPSSRRQSSWEMRKLAADVAVAGQRTASGSRTRARTAWSPPTPSAPPALY